MDYFRILVALFLASSVVALKLRKCTDHAHCGEIVATFRTNLLAPYSVYKTASSIKTNIATAATDCCDYS